MNAPLTFEWTGEEMKPLARFMRFADRQFVVGETYPLVVHEERSTNSHNHYHACISEAWKNLPEKAAKRYPTADHLRKWALAKAGYADERSIVCDTADEALKVAAFIKPIDEFAVIVVADCTVKVFTAKSQSAKAMNKEDFQASKQAVLDIVADLIGVTTEQLAQQTKATDQGKSKERNDPIQESSDGMAPIPGDTEQAGRLQTTAGLPQDWAQQYVAALKRAMKKESLAKYAGQFWTQFGGFDQHRDTVDGRASALIFDAFRDHFADPQKRDAILFELGVS